MNEREFIIEYYGQCAKHLLHADVVDLIIDAKSMILATKEKGGKLIFCGNGASASLASHASVDYTKQAKVRSVNFNEPSLITAFSNDYGYANWVAKALEYYAEADDTIILISCSGTSPNIVKAAEYAENKGIPIITFTGFLKDNALKGHGTINFWVDSKAYNIIEGMHHIWLLSICDLIVGKSEYPVNQ